MNSRLPSFPNPRRLFSASIFAVVALLWVLFPFGTFAATATSANSVAASVTARPTGLSLSASPPLVDVGEAVDFSLHAKTWHGKATAVLSFVSPHHGFTGTMRWDGSCNCFRIAVALAKRIHPLEKGQASATVRFGGGVATVGTTFTIRGLAPNGRDYAPGGTAYLTGWVSDPSPNQKQFQHYCAWVKTADGLGVRGFRVTFVVHFSKNSQRLGAGLTGSTGILCVSRSIGTQKAGQRVFVDVYANSLHTRTSFTPSP